MQSLELLLDPVTDAAVRAHWAALSQAGLPSQQDHRGATNAPHVTVALAGRTTPAAEAALVDLATRLPLPLRLGGLLVLGQRRLVLARLVVPSAELLDLHASAREAWGGLPDQPDLVQPGRWTPHVTLARGLTADQAAAALQTLATTAQVPPTEALVGTATALRRWDPVTGQAWTIGSQVDDRPRHHRDD